MATHPTVYDVASEAGVSIATVSRVLRHPHEVRKETQERVQRAIITLGYVPSGSARSLADQRTGVLGILLPSLQHMSSNNDVEPIETPPTHVDAIHGHNSHYTQPEWGSLYYGEVLRGAEFEAWNSHRAIMIASPRTDEAGTMSMIRDVTGRVDGLAIFSTSLPQSLLTQVSKRIPSIVVAGPITRGTVDRLTIDNVGGMRALTTHLIVDHKIHDLMFISGPRHSPDSLDRFTGFCQALRTHGISPPNVPRYYGDFTENTARRLATSLLNEVRRGTTHLPRALVCCNDETALGFLDVLRRARIRVPQDTVLTGFDGIQATCHSHPPLTTVSQPMMTLGRAAVKQLIARLGMPEAPIKELYLPVTLVLRQSCGCP